MNQWGAPPDAVAWAALVLSLTSLALFWDRVRFEALLLRLDRRWFLTLVTLLSAALSFGYWVFYLRGGSRIIDATSYLLEARLLAHGQLAFEPPGPLASFHGRFLYATPQGTLTPIFPPGYPLVLAAAIRLGSPGLLGPALAAGITALTYLLSRRLFADETLARVAALASVFSAVLRYHTADTMSHGLSALLFTGALLFTSAPALTLTGQRSARGAVLAPLAAGLLLGGLFACRPLTGLVAGAAWLLWTGYRPRAWLLGASSASLGIGGFFWHQSVLTGTPGQLVQHAYYATADGPPGCVRLGFGAEIGCRVEHGEFVARYLPNGHGLWEAFATTGRRLVMHLGDACNLELSLPLVVLAAVWGWRLRAVRLLVVTVALQIGAHAVFYFDGNYPGGGARLFADTLPLEHLAIAWVLCRFGQQRWLLPTMLGGFALHGAYDHRQLSERDGGAPMYEPERIPAGTELVFLDTDHGFGLGFSPAPDPRTGQPLVAMRRGDAHDWQLWNLRGRPPSVRYSFDPTGRAPTTVEPFVPSFSRRFEAESNWPALAVRGGWIEPRYVASACASGGRVVRLHPSEAAQLHPNEAAQLHPSEAARLQLEFELWVTEAGPHVLRVAGDRAVSVAGLAARSPTGSGADFSADFASDDPAIRPECPRSLWDVGWLEAGRFRVTLETSEFASLDFLELEPTPTVAPKHTHGAPAAP